MTTTMIETERDDDRMVLTERGSFVVFYLNRGLSYMDASDAADRMLAMGYKIPDDWDGK